MTRLCSSKLGFLIDHSFAMEYCIVEHTRSIIQPMHALIRHITLFMKVCCLHTCARVRPLGKGDNSKISVLKGGKQAYKIKLVDLGDDLAKNFVLIGVCPSSPRRAHAW